MRRDILKNTAAKATWLEIRPLSEGDSVAVTALRSNVYKLEGTAARGPFNGIIERVAVPDGVTFEAGGWAKQAQARKGATIIHAHGGWFNWGTGEAFRNLVGHIALSDGADAFIPDFRLAPEHPFPTVVRDLEARYRGSGSLLHQVPGRRARPLLSGRDRSEESAGLPPLRSSERPASNPRSRWRRRSAARRLAPYVERAVAAGVDAKLDVWMGTPHGFVNDVGRFNAATQALSAIGAFLTERPGEDASGLGAAPKKA